MRNGGFHCVSPHIILSLARGGAIYSPFYWAELFAMSDAGRMFFVFVCVLWGGGLSGASANADEFGARLSAAALERTEHRVTYDPAYVALSYPGGDVADDRGVCADLVVRALRALDVDLQQLVHEDMKVAFDAYPAHWGLRRPDRNIDHRRVPNLETYFSRRGAQLNPSNDAADYVPGDIVAWNLLGESGGWRPHMGIVTDRIAASGRLVVAHNIGAGPRAEDVLFNWPMTGRYRLRPDH